MPLKLDLTSGTKDAPIVAPFEGKRNAIVIIAFCDGDKALVPGYAESAQKQVVGVLETAGLNPSSAREVWTLEADEKKTSYVRVAVNVAKDVPEEPQNA